MRKRRGRGEEEERGREGEDERRRLKMGGGEVPSVKECPNRFHILFPIKE